ncbi:ABC transporter permease [Pengzhenrongella sp.]|jgi:peptide/nickel transport system permease protein|uniref:ABC transporter permease n=1 Tax=Pengzhenrongella sp. TaxID=2888820 RepID=UPI002F945AFE
MARYLAARLAAALAVLWAAYTVSFLVLYALPGDPVSSLLGADSSDVTPAQLDAVRAQYGFDLPLPVQYVQQLWRVLHGDLGRSVGTGRPVLDLIGGAIGPTAQIAGAALVLAIVVGSALALVATAVPNRRLGAALLGLPPLGVAIPSFWFGLALVQVFSFTFPIFPAVRTTGLASIVLPAITLALPASALIAQVLATSLRRTLAEPYIDTAWAKGAGRARVHLGHALRNAALPALTIAGLVVGGLLSGAVVTETVFSRAGLGRLTATSVGAQDIPVVQGLVVFAAAVFVVVNLVVDLIYPVLDPRILRTP